MKNLKYMLFAFLICFISLSNVRATATCVYENESEFGNIKLLCTTKNNKLTCENKSKGNSNISILLRKSEDFNLTHLDFQKNEGYVCLDNIYLATSFSGTNIVIEDIYKENSGNNLLGIAINDTESYDSINNNVKICGYQNEIFVYVCEIVNGKSTCEFGYVDPSRNAYDITNVQNGVNTNDLTCSTREQVYACREGASTIVKVVKNADECGEYEPMTLTYQKPVVEVPEQENNSDNPESNSGTNTSDDGSASSKDEELDLDNFCQGSVQGVFTTLGWVFFILKILVPLIIIIFGCIDLGKAVIASKDDEIKKSVKSLVVRAIAGIIIFFVPTVLNFIVSVIDDDNIYNGTFWDCTKCIFNPDANMEEDGYVCSSLGGE